MALKTRPNLNETVSHSTRISRSGRPQIGVIRDRTALGQAARRLLNGASRGGLGGPSGLSELGDLVLGGAPATRWYFCYVFLRGLVGGVGQRVLGVS